MLKFSSLFCFCSVVKINPQENDMFFDVTAVVDPLTREAQRMAQILIVRYKLDLIF